MSGGIPPRRPSHPRDHRSAAASSSRPAAVRQPRATASAASSGSLVQSAQPIRHPDLVDAPTMSRRAWWLIALNILIPGSAQALAGNRRLGRFGLGATLLGWFLVIVLVVVFLASKPIAITLFTNPWFLILLQALIVGYLALWIVLTIDTLRLANLVRAAPGSRLGAPLAALVALAAFLAAGGYGVASAATTISTVGSVFGGSIAEPPVDGRYNVLLLGGDAGADREGMRPDSITLASIDADTGESVLIGLPRELHDVPFVEGSPMHDLFPDGFHGCASSVCYLNSVYTEVEVFHPELYPDAVANGSRPGYEATKDAVEAITGLTIQYTVVVDMAGFAQLIDALGGIEVNVEKRIPIGGQRDDLKDVKAWIEPGVQHLDGNLALWYARARHGSSDYERMQRQRVVQEAILRQFEPITVVTKFQEIAAAGANVMSTDVPQSMIGPFVDLALKAKDTQVQKLEMVPPNVDPERPDYDYIRQLVATATAPAPAA